VLRAKPESAAAQGGLLRNPKVNGDETVIKLTSENLSAYVRIALYHLGMFLVTHGAISGETMQAWSGVVLNILTFAWTLYGQRVIAKINEIAKIPNLIVVAPPALANNSPADNVVSTSAAQVVSK
jgi:hypothetical protein